MGYFERNLEAIKLNRKLLYDGIEQLKESTTIRKIDDIYLYQTKDGDYATVVKKDNKEYRLNSIYSPHKESIKWVEQFKLDIIDNIIAVFGFGSGSFTNEIIKNMDDSNTLLIYEPSIEIFLHSLNNYELWNILTDNRVRIVVDKINDFEFHSTLRSVLKVTNLQTQINCSLPNYSELFPEDELLFWKTIKDACNFARININTNLRFGNRFITNVCKNLKFIKNSYTLYDLKNVISTDVPAIIVSAGPSVEKNIDELKRAKGKAVIFAVDRILDYLLDNGVVPDYVATVDPMKPVKYFSLREDINIPLISFMEANYEILDQHIGDKVIVNSSKYLSYLYEDFNKPCPLLISSPSVATVTCTTCVELGFKTIIFVGQDLAYSGSITHAGGVEEAPRGEDNLYTEDINGNMIKTRYDWKEFITWFQDLIFLHPEVKFIDAKTEGAKIKGTEILTLKEVIDKECIQYFETISLEGNKTFNSDEMIKVKKYLSDDLQTLDEINRRSNEAILICKKMINSINDNKNNELFIIKYSKILKNINDYILKQPVYWLIDDYITANNIDILGDVYIFSNNIEDDRIKTYKKSISMFQCIIDAVAFVKPNLKEGLNNIM